MEEAWQKHTKSIGYASKITNSFCKMTVMYGKMRLLVEGSCYSAASN